MSTPARSYEIEVGQTNSYLKRLGLADVRRIPPPVSIVSRFDRTRMVKARLEKRSLTDFEGVMRGGRFVALELKTSQNPQRFPLDQVEEHQLERLRSAEAFGGIGVLLVKRVIGRAVQYGLVPRMLEKGAPRQLGGKNLASWRWEELDGLGCRIGLRSNWCSWIMEGHYERLLVTLSA